VLKHKIFIDTVLVITNLNIFFNDASEQTRTPNGRSSAQSFSPFRFRWQMWKSVKTTSAKNCTIYKTNKITTQNRQVMIMNWLENTDYKT